MHSDSDEQVTDSDEQVTDRVRKQGKNMAFCTIRRPELN